MGLKEDWSEILDRLRDEGMDDIAKELDEKFSNTGLRRRLSDDSKVEEENRQLREEVASLKAGPKRREALAAVGVNYDGLSLAERAVVDAAAAEQYDDGWARGLVEQFQLPVEGDGTADTSEIPAAQFGKPEGPAGQAAKGGAGSGTVTPDTYSSWSREKRMRFMAWAEKNNRQDAIAALDDGEPATGVTFS